LRLSLNVVARVSGKEQRVKTQRTIYEKLAKLNRMTKKRNEGVLGKWDDDKKNIDIPATSLESTSTLSVTREP
jgi:hypothetical protein